MISRPVAGLWILAALNLAGCNAPGGVVSGPPAGSDIIKTTIDSDAAPQSAAMTAVDAGDGMPSIATAVQDASLAAPVYQGSPLCNAGPSPSPGDCLPDDPDGSPLVCSHAPDGGSFAYGDASGFACHVATLGSLAGQPTCLPTGTGVSGEACLFPFDCAAGFECVSTPIGTSCQHYCCKGNSQCEASEFCDIRTVIASPTTPVPVCMPKHQCTLLDGFDCPYQTCAVVKEDGSTSCVDVGRAKVGDPCDTDHCQGGLVCLGAVGSRSCFQLCYTGGANGASDAGLPPSAHECPPQQMCKGGMPLFMDPAYGICM